MSAISFGRLRDRLLIIALALFLASSAKGQNPPDVSQVTVKVVPVALGVYMLEGLGGNT